MGVVCGWWPRGLLPILTALLVLAGNASGAISPELAQTRKTLVEVERRIRETAADLAQKKRREEQVAADLAAVAAEQRRMTDRVARIGRQLQLHEEQIAAEEENAARLRTSLDTLEGQVRRRLAALYKSGGVGLLRVLFSATSPARMAEDYDFLGRILRRDRELLAVYRSQLAEQEAVLARLARLREEQKLALAASREEQTTLKGAAKLQQQLVAELRRQNSALAQKLTELRERAARLGTLLKSLETAKTPEYTEKPGLFAKQQGRLPWPVAGPVSTPFGTGRHPVLGTLHDSQGIEIACGANQPFAAVWQGRVIYASWFKGYGNLLIVDHGDSFYSLYAQAARLDQKVGAEVAQGAALGLSGYEGMPGLYFEIRHSGTPLNPQDWLAPR
jgi:septal ring factor EnvC (AmiA/AmiB activator)